ncbi:Na-translocating system protein MpsC family protein [Priestia megaterium]|uniref:Na-translocating system protein MpsC family protein n=1 Tax=Priestia megaterium TaxID=1404 RepID=UPI002E23C322|nr:Na-translocating system protein MpsC family protein [Priestia megaterium]
MSKKIHDFNDIIRKLRKNLFGKGPEFIARTTEGKETVHMARTKLIQNLYASSPPEGLEDLLGAKLEYLFSDIKVEEDIAVSVFVFETNIQ